MKIPKLRGEQRSLLLQVGNLGPELLNGRVRLHGRKRLERVSILDAAEALIELLSLEAFGLGMRQSRTEIGELLRDNVASIVQRQERLLFSVPLQRGFARFHCLALLLDLLPQPAARFFCVREMGL